MRIVIDISEYDKEWIGNAYGIPQDINTKIAKAIINAEPCQPEPHWIPVTERLPKVSGEYFVTKRGMYTHRLIVDIAVYFVNDGWHKADPVIAWMPLPEPYKGVTE